MKHLMRLVVAAVLMLLLFQSVQAQSSSPPWPAWIWDNNNGLGFPNFPPGTYPVEHFGVPVTLTVGSDGSLSLSDGGQFFVLGTSVHCMDADCQSVAIDTIFVDPMTMSQSYSTIILHWNEWSTFVEPPSTPQSTPTRRFPTPTPRHTPTPRPTVTPMSTPQDCPPESVSQQPPEVSTFEVWPPKPGCGRPGWAGPEPLRSGRQPSCRASLVDARTTDPPQSASGTGTP
jgi:hypothetical protein